MSIHGRDVSVSTSSWLRTLTAKPATLVMAASRVVRVLSTTATGPRAVPDRDRTSDPQHSLLRAMLLVMATRKPLPALAATSTPSDAGRHPAASPAGSAPLRQAEEDQKITEFPERIPQLATTVREGLLADGLLAVWRPRQRAVFVNDAVGGVRAAAALLQVAPSQTSRWAKGESVPSMEQARMLIDVDHVVAHALLVWADADGVQDWLSTPNGHLDNLRPIDWIRQHGTADVVDALRAEAAGAYV